MIIRYAQLHIHSTPTLFYLFHVQPTAFSLAEYLFILSFYVSILHGLIRATIQVDTADSPSHTRRVSQVAGPQHQVVLSHE